MSQDLQMPPVGAIPAMIHKQRVDHYISICGGVHLDSLDKSRAIELSGAILQYLSAGLHVNIEWIEEYNEIVVILNEK